MRHVVSKSRLFARNINSSANSRLVFLLLYLRLGITPMLQVVHQMLKDPEDDTEIYLLFANQVRPGY